MIQAEYPKHDGNNQRNIIVFVVKEFHGFPVSYRAFRQFDIVVNQMLRYYWLMPSADILERRDGRDTAVARLRFFSQVHFLIFQTSFFTNTRNNSDAH